ncbi:MAG: Translation elongation factor P [Microgenomates group bacterium GW2011_GWA1_48_10]|nr:MAG: Translation elongation factor P [Microgenomates group bacterium GW2011_GWA1_48_10]
MQDVREIQEIVEKMDGWLSFAEGSFLYNAARNASGRGAVVEIGSGKGGRVYAIDPHTGAPEHHEIFKTKNIWTFDEFKKNIKAAGVEPFVSPIVDRSENVARDWKNPVAFLWIDGAHAYEAAILDFESWFPHLKEGGVIAYHDSTFQDVRRVMKEKVFFSRNFKNVGVVDSVTHATKVSPESQTFLDRARNMYVYLLSGLYGLRNIPIPSFIRTPAKAAFKKFVSALQ